jgi:hypothetical protein
VTRDALLERLRSRKYAVESSVSSDGAPQSAIVGIAVSDRFEIVFDTLTDTRKARNLELNPQVAFTVGSLEADASWSIQYEGVVDQPAGEDLARLVDLYLSVFPDGLERQSWPGLIYLRARPMWLRYSDFRPDPPEIVEFGAAELAALT